jgi:hypothetical protein
VKDDQFKDIPEHIREKLPPELSDAGGGKSAMAVNSEMVDACHGARDYVAGVVEKARALAQNIKDNGASFDEAWAGFISLTHAVGPIDKESAPVLLAYVLTEEVWAKSALHEGQQVKIINPNLYRSGQVGRLTQISQPGVQYWVKFGNEADDHCFNEKDLEGQ